MSRSPVAETADLTKPMLVRFDPEMLARVDAVRGKASRAALVREAVERELQRREGENGR